MNFSRLLAPGALFTLLAVSSTAFAQNISSSEMRSMSASEFERHIDEEGPQQFLHRFINDVDPHSPEEPNYDIVLERVAEGSTAWLHAVARIAPYAEATFSEGIRVAIADALIVNPTGVLNLVGTEEHFDQACGYPFVHQTDTYLLRHKRDALAALARVRQPTLASKKESCRKQLMDLPTNSARDDVRASPVHAR